MAAAPQAHHRPPRGFLSLGDKHLCCPWPKRDCRSLLSQLSHEASGERNHVPHPGSWGIEPQARKGALECRGHVAKLAASKMFLHREGQPAACSIRPQSGPRLLATIVTAEAVADRRAG